VAIGAREDHITCLPTKVKQARFMEESMPYRWQALSAVWMIIFAVFGLLASRSMSGPALWLIVLGGLAAPAIILAFDDRHRNTPQSAPIRSEQRNPGFQNRRRGIRGG
jgi:hypothetical protein